MREAEELEAQVIALREKEEELRAEALSEARTEAMEVMATIQQPPHNKQKQKKRRNRRRMEEAHHLYHHNHQGGPGARKGRRRCEGREGAGGEWTPFGGCCQHH